jgi:hypothetical protein
MERIEEWFMEHLDDDGSQWRIIMSVLVLQVSPWIEVRLYNPGRMRYRRHAAAIIGDVFGLCAPIQIQSGS